MDCERTPAVRLEISNSSLAFNFQDNDSRFVDFFEGLALTRSSVEREMSLASSLVGIIARSIDTISLQRQKAIRRPVFGLSEIS